MTAIFVVIIGSIISTDKGSYASPATVRSNSAPSYGASPHLFQRRAMHLVLGTLNYRTSRLKSMPVVHAMRCSRSNCSLSLMSLPV